MVTDELIFNDFKNDRIGSLYQSLFPALTMFASDILTARYAYLAEDCVQDAIYKAYKRRSAFVNFEALKAFLYTCTRNSAISILRKGHAQANFIEEKEHVTTAPDLSDDISLQEVKRHIFTAIDSLPDHLREVFELSFVQGLGNAEIAEILGLSVSAVKKRKVSLKTEMKKGVN